MCVSRGQLDLLGGRGEPGVASQELHKRRKQMVGDRGVVPGGAGLCFQERKALRKDAGKGWRTGGRGFRSAPTQVSLTFGQSAPFLLETTGRSLSSCPPAPALIAWDGCPISAVEEERLGSSNISAALGPGGEGRTECQAGRLARWTDHLPETQPAAKPDGRPQAAGQTATGVGRQGHQDGSPPPGSAPRPAAHTPGLGHRFIFKCRHNPAIGFLITDSYVHGINILTN